MQGWHVAVAALAAASFAPTKADAAVVTQLGTTAGYLALPGEANRVSATRSGDTVVFEDEGEGLLVAGPGCAASGRRIACAGARTLHFDVGGGDDAVVNLSGLHAMVLGGAGNDTLRGGAAADELHGGPGNDLLDGGAAGDLLDGGPGTDTGDYSQRISRVIVTLDGRADDGEIGEGDNVVATENVLGGRGGDILVGDGGPNALHGGPGDDALAGRGGSDVLIGGPGRDGINAGDPPIAEGGADAVGCGDGRDRVVGDPADYVSGDCEVIDRGGTLGYTASVDVGADPPQLGRSVVVRPVSGVILIVPPEPGADSGAAQPVPASPPVPLDDERNIPIGSVVDTRFGTVELTVAVDGAGATQAGEFHSGPFQVFQEPVDGALADLRLRGGKSFAACPAGQRGHGLAVFASRNRQRRGSPVRRLWGEAKGSFRTGGRFAAATVRGTRWLTEDRCEGTLVRVAHGAVLVRDAVTGRSVVVSAGEEYLVRAP